MHYVYIFTTITLTVYGQMILKWQISLAGGLPVSSWDKIVFLIKLMINPWVFSCWVAGFLAGLAWMAALTHFRLSYVYPFMGLTFALVLLLSGLFLNETVTNYKVTGILLIVIGIYVGSQG